MLKKTKLLILSLALLPLIATANDWTTHDTQLQSAVLTLFLIDAAQTKDIKSHRDLHETNPLLGEHPSDSRIKNYFVGAGLVHTGLAVILPQPYRGYLQAGTIALEVSVIGNNKRLGLHMRF